MENLNMNISLNGETLRYLVDTVFLPAKVPDKEETGIYAKESALIAEVLKAAAMFKVELGQAVSDETSQAWKIVCRMLKKMHCVRSSGTMTKIGIKEELGSMNVGDVLPIYIPGQNAGIIFRKRSTKELTFESFEISLPNEVVMGTIGKVVAKYPANPRITIPVNEELLSTLAGALPLFSIQHLGEVFPVIRKADAGHENLRDTASPRYITEALAGFLRGVGTANDANKPGDETIFIQKRIDDRIVFGGGKGKPWRRSAMWLLIRVSLQTTLEELDIAGGEGYKAFQTYFMAHLLQQCSASFDIVPDDVLDAMNRKVARRLWKLKDFVDERDRSTHALDFAGSVVSKVASSLQKRWEDIRKECVNKVKWAAPTLASIQDSLELSLQVNQAYLKSVVERTRKLAQATNQYDDATTTRRLIAACSDRLDVYSREMPSSIIATEMDIGLMDFEYWVENQLTTWSESSSRSPEHDSVFLSSIIDTYVLHGLSHYAGAPERFSVFWLTTTELWVALDKLVVKWDNLLSDYSPEIPHDFLDPLLLPTSSQLKRLDTVQSYIRNRHSAARHDVSPFGDINSPQSFQNVYFTRSSKLQEERRMIEQWGRKEKQETLQKLRVANEKYECLMVEYRSLSCQYETYTTWHGDQATRHLSYCLKCFKLREATGMRTPRFEDPLPTNARHANSLVFELNCPKIFGLWREATYRVLLRAFSYSQTSNSMAYDLKSYSPTNRFHNSRDRQLSIGSSTVSIASSFYGNPSSLPATPETIAFPHSGRYCLTYDGNWLKVRGESVLRPLCTLQLDKPYQSLDTFISNTIHSPNSVIASQARCPASINLGEYLAFGHLRSGNDIQIPNVMRAIISDSLSLNEPAVHSLLMQTIWQTGPNKGNRWYRDAHEYFSDAKFAQEMLIVLGESLERVGDSGRETLHLATLTALATRLLSMSQESEIRESCLSFLGKARERASEWMALVESEVATNTNDDPARLQHKMSLIAVVWRLTFDVDADILERLCGTTANVTTLQFTKMVIAGDSTQSSSLSSGIQLLFRRDSQLAYRLEPHIASSLKRTSNPLHEATRRIWGGYQRGSRWTALSSRGIRWWKCVTARTEHLEPRSVYVNILTGDMLVDGKTPDRLPPSYVTHETYKNLFDESVSLRSRPSTMRGMEYEATYKGRQLHFAMVGGSLVVRLLRDEIVEEFIPQAKIQGDVSTFFVQEQRHWYIEAGGRRLIEFRPTKACWSPNLSKNWTLDLNERVRSGLRGTLAKISSLGLEQAMDPHCPLFKHIHHAVKGVERLLLSVHIVARKNCDGEAPLLNLTLSNHTLDFFVNPKGELESSSFRHYILDTDQDIGCLYGLEDCLVLRDSSPSQRFRKVVIPRGIIEAMPSTRRHPIIHVKANEKGGYHLFDVDSLVGRLVGNGAMESELFLIQLHAFTTSHCRDPLTNRTGTEEALGSLKSRSLLSHHVPSAQWRSQMDQIAATSPRRGYYPHWSKAMEQVHWNANLPVAAQHSGFEKRITNILSYWADLDIQKSSLDYTRPYQPASGMTELSRRAALRDLRTTSSRSALQRCDGDDYKHDYRDVLQSPESRRREALAYQVSFCTYHRRAGLPVCSQLEQMAKQWGSIEAAQAWGWQDFPEWFSGSVSSLWSTLYGLSCVASCDQEGPNFGVAMTFAMIAYREKVPLPILGTLVAIIRDPEFGESEFNHLFEHTLDMTLGSSFKESEVRSLVTAQQVGFNNSAEANLEAAPGRDHAERLSRRKAIYNSAVSQEAEQIVLELKRWWHDTSQHHSVIVVSSQPHLKDLKHLIRVSIHPLLKKWLQNKQFLEHLAVVNLRISSISHPVLLPAQYRPRFSPLRRSHHDITDVRIEHLLEQRDPKHKAGYIRNLAMPTVLKQQPASSHNLRVLKTKSLVEKLGSVLHGRIEAKYRDDLRKSMEAFSESSSVIDAQIPAEADLSALRKAEEECLYLMHTQILHILAPSSPAEKLLSEGGLWPCATSQTLLSRLSLQRRVNTPSKWNIAISLYAQQIVAVQRSRRLYHYGTRSMTTEYNREILHSRERETAGDPDWLLVEIDADICVRSDQMNIAKAMIDPNQGKNTVMQLNMGEGKSSVIVPIVAATLADTNQLVRVVVPKPQSKLQLDLLRRRLSKLANRRIICLPFNRDLRLDIATAKKISSILEACRTEGGIWLCQPEHLLSFKLLGLDLAMRIPASVSVGAELIRCQLWMQGNTRDILDESDEILHTRHQLVYTVGAQTNFDAAPKRWEVVQQLLALMQSHLSSERPSHFLVGTSQYPGQFPSIRMMSNEGTHLFYQPAEKVVFRAAIPSVRMANLPTQLKNTAMRLLTQCKITSDDRDVRLLEKYFQDHDEQPMWESLLIIRGLIAFNILPLALQNKRWRVDYGHDLRRSQLAVPYRAKDSPSLRSDFAHPDVLVLLTCLTYYYSGLDDSMIVRTAKELLKSDNPDLIYEQWISPCRSEVPVALHKFSGVNMDDDKMIVQSLRPFICRNRLAIDFFLNRCVFPKEAKEFPLKMSTSGWDLAMEKTNPTTGFSGTNDSRFLLPTSIVQADSPAQRHTNATVLAHILQDENSIVLPHRNNLTSDQMIEIVYAQEPQPTVLLDVGAQILDCSNKDLVKLWLSKYDEGGMIKAGVFFDDDDNMCILERDGTIQPFSDSPYSTRLDECLVYLDDSHTRGTDLKLPACRAAVTLGPRLPKDKLVQGCMRMRKLGFQHSLIFLAPDEVIREVRKAAGNEDAVVQAFDVLQWAMKETCRQLQVNAANWAMQGYEFAARQIGWRKMSAAGTRTTQQMQDLFCQKESRSLAELYGIRERKSARERAGHGPSTTEQIPMLDAIDQHCKLFESFSFEDARTQEEQEVELVHEQEVEREVERPPAATPASHSIHQHVLDFARTGILDPNSLAFRTVQRSFENTSLRFPTGGTSAFSDLMVTNDFYHTIQLESTTSKIDDFLRPLEWVVTSRTQQSPPALVAFSPYEVNALLPIFRASKKVKLHLFAPRTSLGMRSLEDLQLFTLPTNHPTTPIPSSLSQQLNLYSGTLYLRDLQSYHDIRKALRLHFGDVAAEIADRGVINSNGFVKDKRAREELGLVGRGFDKDPVQFFRQLYHLRRNGRNFLPSHLGQILFGVGLTGTTFDQ